MRRSIGAAAGIAAAIAAVPLLFTAPGAGYAAGRPGAAETAAPTPSTSMEPPGPTPKIGKEFWCLTGGCDVQISIKDPIREDLTVYLRTISGTALPGRDYVPVEALAVTIPAGRTTGVATLRIMPNTPSEGDETFGVQIFRPSVGTIGNADGIVTIKAG